MKKEVRSSKFEVLSSNLEPRTSNFAHLLTALLGLLSLAEAWSLTAIPGLLHGNDFKHLWLGAYLLNHGRSPYDPALLFHAANSAGLGAINPYVYLPTTGLLMGPLAWLAFPAAMIAWFWFNWMLAWLIVLWGPRLLRVGRPDMARLAGAAFLAGAFPFYRQMTVGQMNVVTAALILWSAAALARRRDAWAGVALALGFAWKIAPALLIGALAVMRRWRAAAWGVLGSATLLALSLACFGWPIQRQAWLILRRMGYGQSTWSQYGMDFYRDPFNQSPNALFHHLFTNNPYTRPWLAQSPQTANRLTLLFSLLIAGAWLFQVLRDDRKTRLGATASAGSRERGRPACTKPWHNKIKMWKKMQAGRPRSQGVLVEPSAGICEKKMRREISLFLAASLAMLLLPSLMWDHYCVQALPALLWLFGDRRTTRTLPRALGAATIFLLLAIPLRHGAPEWSHGAGILLMSLRLWPILALYGWLLYDSE